MAEVRFTIGRDAVTGKFITLSYDPDAPRCGRDCTCCEYPDGTAPGDHDRDCDLITNRDGDWSDCSCDGAEDRSKDRKRVRLFVGACIHSNDPRRPT